MMIYRNVNMPMRLHWWPETNPEAGSIARDFLVGERDLLRFTRAEGEVVSELEAFLEVSAGLSLVVRRAPSGEILLSVDPWSESLLLTGRTAEVLSGYLDRKVVRMEDRFDMTVRQAVRAM